MGAKLVFLALVMTAVASVTAENELARGWGEDIDWKGTGLKLAQSEGKQLMLVIHKSWCGACKNLKPQFEKSEQIAELSQNFVMVNTLDDEEPQEDKYKIDGGYIPRIFFISPNGDVRADIYNEKGNPSYKYFYSNPSGIVDSMKKAMSNSNPAKDDL